MKRYFIFLFLFNLFFLTNGSVRIPNVNEASVKMNDNKLYLKGYDLNLTKFSNTTNELLVNANDGYVDLNNTDINTFGYFLLKSNVTQPFSIELVGYLNQTINVFILTCMKPNCSGNGICLPETMECKCEQGWGGSDCSIDLTYQCVNNCSGNGVCSIDMTCNCNKDYTGVSCDQYSPDIGLSMTMNKSLTQPSITMGSFSTNSKNTSLELNDYTKSSEYSILIPYIQEIDFNGELVKNYTFSNSNDWQLIESTKNSTTGGSITIYQAQLSAGSKLTVSIELIKIATTREWAGQLMTLPDHSIKYSVRIENYTFVSNLNNLQLIYQASPNSKLSTECEIKQSIAWGAKKSTDMHWVTLPNNQVSLYGKFSNYLIADGRIVSTSNEGLEFGTTIQVKVNIPFFKEYIELDPDFSVLVNSGNMNNEQYDECGILIKKNNDNRKWVIPVAVVVSVVGAAIIVALLMSLFYTKNTNVRTKILSFKYKLKRNNKNNSSIKIQLNLESVITSPNVIYPFAITPFYPGSDNQSLYFKLSSIFDSPTTLSGYAVIYNNLNQIITSGTYNLILDEYVPTIGPSTTDATLVDFNEFQQQEQQQQQQKLSIDSQTRNKRTWLKAFQIANYTLIMPYSLSSFMDETTKSFYDYYYLHLEYIDPQKVKQVIADFKTVPFSFNAPAYNTTKENSIISTKATNNNILGFGLDYNKHLSIVTVNNAESGSYGMFYSKDIYNDGSSTDSTFSNLQFIKNLNGLDYYYYYNKFNDSQLAETTEIIIDEMTGQQRQVSTTFTNNHLPKSITSQLVLVNGWSFCYGIFVSNEKIESMQLDGWNIVPISIKSNSSNYWTSIARLTLSPSDTKIRIDISKPVASQWTTELHYTQPTPLIPAFTKKVTLLSNQFYKIPQYFGGKYRYENKQIQILVELNFTDATQILNSIDYKLNDIIFLSDRELFSKNYYCKIISLPDYLITSSTVVFAIYGNYESVGRVLFYSNSSVSIDIISPQSDLISTVKNSIEIGKGNEYFTFVKGSFSMTPQTFYEISEVTISLTPVGKLTTNSKPSPNSREFLNISSSFPHGFIGSGNNLQWTPYIPIASDTPSMIYSLVGPTTNPSITLTGTPFIKKDLINPSLTVKFNWALKSNQEDEFLISIWDTVGVGQSTCKFSFATNSFSLSPSSIHLKSINHTYISQSLEFSIKLKFNRYFCSIVSPVIDCSDIKGNRLFENDFSTTELRQLFFENIDQCTGTTSIPTAHLFANFVTFNSATNVTFSSLFGNVFDQDYNVVVQIFGDYENKGPIENSIPLTMTYLPETNSALFKGNFNFSIDSTTLSKKKFISINVSKKSNPTSTFTLSTKELEFINKLTQKFQTTTAVVDSQFIIRNKDYQGPELILRFLRLGDFDNSQPTKFNIKSSQFTNIKNLTLTIKDTFNSYTQSLVYLKDDPTSYFNLSDTLLTLNAKYNYLNPNAFIESFCDIFDNCYELSPTAFQTSQQYINIIPSPIIKPVLIGTPTFSRNFIDVSSSNRKLKISIDLKYSNNEIFTPSYGQDPIFYISEKQTNEKIQCSLKQISNLSSSLYTCDMEIPLYWGLRMVGQCSVWNMVDSNGVINGGVIQNCPIFFFYQDFYNPNIWQISVMMNDTVLYVTGTNLDLLPSKILDYQSLLVSTSNLTMINGTLGFYTLKAPANNPFSISVDYGFNGIKNISVFIQTCMKSDCSGNGVCNVALSTCTCKNGWGGSDCSIDMTFKCINNCSGKGICSNDMTCNCNKDYTGVSCNQYSPDLGLSMTMNTSKNQPSIDLGSFSTNSSSTLNDYTKSSGYSILIPYIQEIDFNGKLVKNYTFTTDSWSLLSVENNILIYNTTLTEYSKVLVELETITVATTREWAGQLLNLPDHSIKYSVRIENYTFVSNLNNLQLVYQASPSSKLSTECEIKQSIAWGAKKSTDMHWVTLPNNQVSLYGKFSNYLIADGRIVSTSNEGLEFGTTIQVKVNIPFFKEYIELDPDFSVLVDPNFNEDEYDECGIKIENSSNYNDKRKWILPVAVVVSVVGAAIVVTVLMSVLYTKNISVRTKMLSFKSKFKKNNNISMKTMNN
ncbi:hypothetical protein ACTFIR_001324 [Dictyostelium discoideum]